MRKFTVIQSDKESASFLENKGEKSIFSNETTTARNSYITIHAEEEFQEWMGFGGAFSEAASYTLSQISPQNRSKVIQSYFDKKEGLAYNLGRTHINSCDFALENYTYVEENDTTLESFTIDREKEWVLPLIHDAKEIAGEELTILSSPWSPPAWMKTNNEMNNGGKLKEEFRQLWADYYAAYITAMEENDVKIWGVTVQNEPAVAQTWDSCEYTAEEERDFVKNYLGPTLQRAGYGDKKIIIWDHNRDMIVERASAVLSDPEAAQYVWGTGNHWYVSEEFENLSKVHEQFPDKHLLFTEGCIEGGVQLGAWGTGERYARNIIGDMNNWLEGFIDWNLVLNEQGGPNHVGNYCDAPIIADTERDVVHFNSSYYYIGHFSKYIRPGAKRVKVNSSAESLSLTAFKNNPNEIIVVLLNETEEDQSTKIEMQDYYSEVHLPKRSITTCIIER
ncbi:glucosylceramidase [Halobacillus halophilus]|uniref:Glucosylceramidase n=1 Tax=Halobacillus halophilus (strain ATCC 35676 / DSM 2266 / JCM 20832 / KCTC 3685 / LMG 17431 / NBRC 102448 / NCIMB 2269) TaxID=866895 RepID=I0JRF8_HALH3|nr:glucosylceramidase [Halobacillus halophilus]CCG46728.1 glucosylceramidase [Halobacillus halophilus DSM 2266]